jgi:Ca2+-binding EF-hand superfamily protein
MMHDIFNEIDEDGSGFIDYDELKKFMSRFAEM